jgi:hypothetical protein
VRLKLDAGDMLIMDNYRLLHGRTAFQLEGGVRHMRQGYLDRDSVGSRQRVSSAWASILPHRISRAWRGLSIVIAQKPRHRRRWSRPSRPATRLLRRHSSRSMLANGSRLAYIKGDITQT